MFEKIQFRTPSTHFGIDAINNVGKEAKNLGALKALLVSGPSIAKTGMMDKVISLLRTESVEVDVNIQERNTPEPTTDIVEATAKIAKEGKYNLIVGLGGGSVLDVAKMASALVINPGITRDYFGKEKLPKRGIPTIIIPTTAGTGAEMTKHAIFLDREVKVKKAVASTNLLPDVAIIDPMLTLNCPPIVTASAGIDAFFHAAEPFVSKNANYVTDTLALRAIELICRWLGPAYSDGQNIEARYYMSLGSMISGMVLNNSGTSLIHALSYPVGGELHTPHGVTLCALAPACFKYIIVAKQEKMAQLAEAMGESVKGLSAKDAASLIPDAVKGLMKSVGLPTCLRDLNINDKSRFSTWAVEAHKEQRLLSRSPYTLSLPDIQKIYEMAF